jgi:hypothetical protein
MSDKPLFQDMDEQEAQYAPHQLPPGSAEARQARIEEGTTGSVADEATPEEGAIVAGTAAGGLTGGNISGQMGATGPTGVPAVGPVVAGEAIQGNTGVEAGDQEEQ